MAQLKHGVNSEYWKDFFEQHVLIIKEQESAAIASKDKGSSVFSNDNYCDYYDDYYDDNDYNLSIEERASMLWRSMDMEYDWCYAYYKTQYMRKPINISLNRWSNIQRALRLFQENEFCIFREVISCNWKLYDIFGCENALLILIDDGFKIVTISHEAIKLEDSRGDLRIFKRPFLDFSNQILIHELD